MLNTLIDLSLKRSCAHHIVNLKEIVVATVMAVAALGLMAVV